MPKSNLLDLVARATAAHKEVEENVGKARADAMGLEEALMEQVRAAIRKQVDAQLKVSKNESVKLERQLLDEIQEAVVASVGDLDFKPLLKDTLDPQFDALKEEVRKGAFVDRSAAMQKAVETMADRVVAAVSKSVAAIPKQDLKPLLKEVRDAVAAIKFPALMVVTKWEHKVVRDPNGLIDHVDSIADEWSEI